MIRKLIFVVLAIGLLFYVRSQRKRNYPMDTVTANGQTFMAIQLPKECQGVACMHRAAYLTSLTDTSELRVEAEDLLAWLEPKIKNEPPPLMVGIMAIEPGFMRMSKPRRVIGVIFTSVTPGVWKYVQQVDMTAQMRDTFKE